MVLCDTGGTVRFEMGASMIGNTAVGGGDGGGLYCSQCGQVQMDHAQVLNNSAGGNGGGLALVANGATWTSITSSNLSFNHAALDGGAFNVTGGATVLVNNSFVGNYVEGRGGAISCLWAWFGVSPFQHDQAATSVSSEGVRISLSAANAMVQGQTEASTNATGFAHADSFIFGAVPETYPLELSLPDYYPQGGKSWSLKLASGFPQPLATGFLSTRAPKESVKVSELLRALTLWLQYISLLGQANIPAPSTEDHSAPGCATHSVSDWDSNMASEKGRQASGGIHWLSTAYSCYATHHVAEDKLGRRILVSLLTVVFYYYPSTLTNTLSIFTCYRLDTPATLKKYPGNARAKWHGGYWLPDMQRPCWTGWHATHAVPLGVVLMLGCICIFLLPILLLFKHRHKLKSTPLKYRFGFIYRPYRRRFWFWDSIVLMQTFALASAQVFALALSAYFHLTIMLMILVVGFAILAFFQPFEAPLSQNTQFAGMLAVLVTAVGCLYLIDTSNSIETSKGRKAALDADGVLLMSNAALLELQWSNTSSSPAIVYEQSNA
ncbi:hypothetical protein WJX82_003308 [Trebouxia sp. C0006]